MLFVSCKIVFFQYNGVSMKNKTKEDAYLEMLKPADQVMFKVQNYGDSLAVIKESQGDGFFIRCLEFKHFVLLFPRLFFKIKPGK